MKRIKKGLKGRQQKIFEDFRDRSRIRLKTFM